MVLPLGQFQYPVLGMDYPSGTGNDYLPAIQRKIQNWVGMHDAFINEYLSLDTMAVYIVFPILRNNFESVGMFRLSPIVELDRGRIKLKEQKIALPEGGCIPS